VTKRSQLTYSILLQTTRIRLPYHLEQSKHTTIVQCTKRISFTWLLASLLPHNKGNGPRYRPLKTESTTNTCACSLDSWAEPHTILLWKVEFPFLFGSSCRARSVTGSVQQEQGTPWSLCIVDNRRLCWKKSTQLTGSGGPLASSRLYSAGQMVAAMVRI
jgi:hypothetical protein